MFPYNSEKIEQVKELSSSEGALPQQNAGVAPRPRAATVTHPPSTPPSTLPLQIPTTSSRSPNYYARTYLPAAWSQARKEQATEVEGKVEKNELDEGEATFFEKSHVAADFNNRDSQSNDESDNESDNENNYRTQDDSVELLFDIELEPAPAPEQQGTTSRVASPTPFTQRTSSGYGM